MAYVDANYTETQPVWSNGAVCHECGVPPASTGSLFCHRCGTVLKEEDGVVDEVESEREEGDWGSDPVVPTAVRVNARPPSDGPYLTMDAQAPRAWWDAGNRSWRSGAARRARALQARLRDHGSEGMAAAPAVDRVARALAFGDSSGDSFEYKAPSPSPSAVPTVGGDDSDEVPNEHPAGWTRVRHFGRCGPSCGCCRADNLEDSAGQCLICCKIWTHKWSPQGRAAPVAGGKIRSPTTTSPVMYTVPQEPRDVPPDHLRRLGTPRAAWNNPYLTAGTGCVCRSCGKAGGDPAFGRICVGCFDYLYPEDEQDLVETRSSSAAGPTAAVASSTSTLKRKRQGHEPRMPAEMRGKWAQDSQKNHICFSYNVSFCPYADHGGTCEKGLHICCEPFCEKPHPMTDHVRLA